jgi:ABC-type transporter Mla maintaining outer membrane lipid asymmetry ATPase subunit MlaF
MLKLKRELKLTAVVVTHDLDLMRKVADSVVVLYQRAGHLFRAGGGSGEIHHPHIKAFLAMDRVELVPDGVE